MTKFGFINKIILSMIIGVVLTMFTCIPGRAQLPISYYYTQPLYYPTYGYTNAIDSYLLGYNTYSPFLAPAVADVYALAGLDVYPYLTNPYSTTFPYATLDVLAPYAPPVYPTFTYGLPSLYSLWLDLNL